MDTKATSDVRNYLMLKKGGSKKKQLQWMKNKRVKIENNHIYVWNMIDVDGRCGKQTIELL